MNKEFDQVIGNREFRLRVIETRLRRGLRRQLDHLAETWRNPSTAAELFTHLDAACRRIHQFRSDLQALEQEVRNAQARIALGRISWAKNHMLDPESVYLQSADPKTERVAHIYKVYEQELRKANVLDFDDLLLETVRLLRAIPEVRQYWSGRFDYVLVDEYQDTNRPQYELLKAVATAHQNVAAVGDEDQSIYSWRGADIRNILEFEKDFGDAKIIRLEQNYRSTQNILSAASAVVANNVKRKGKNLWTSRQGGAKVGYYEAPDGENEALFAADTISRYVRQSAEVGETARAEVDGQIVTLVRLAGGFYAFQEFCPHQYGPLSEGSLHDGQIQCSWHGSCFDIRTGKVTQGPARDDLRVYEVSVRNNEVYVRVMGQQSYPSYEKTPERRRV